MQLLVNIAPYLSNWQDKSPQSMPALSQEINSVSCKELEISTGTISNGLATVALNGSRRGVL